MAFKTKLLLTLGAATILGAYGSAPARAAESFTPEQKAEIEKILNDYLMEHGELIIDAVDAYRERSEAEQMAKMTETIESNIEKLASADAPFAGNPDGDVTVIEFFDYNCGYCKRALPDIQEVLKTDDNVKFVFHDMPILGESSKTAAQWALAAKKQGKYFEYHSALMEFRGSKTDEELAKIAEKLELDVDKMKKDANSDEVKAEIDRGVELARMVGVSGTPAFIIGTDFYPGYLGSEGFKDAIKKAREDAKNDG